MNVLAPDARDWLGRTIVYPPYPVTALDIAKFCYAVGIDDQIHLSRDAAIAAGHTDVPAPMGYHLVIQHAVPNFIPLSELSLDGGSEDLTPPSTAHRRMAGESSAQFHVPIHAGDTITLTKRIADMTEKVGRSGPLAFVGYDLEFHNQHGHMTVSSHYVRILR